MSATASDLAPTSEARDFITRYCDVLFGCGATCVRLEKNVTRIARALGLHIELSVFPRHIHLTLTGDNGLSHTSVVTIHHRPASFNTNTLLSKLSWDIADGKTSLSQAIARLDTIAASHNGPGKWAELLLVALANASFCRLFGGDFTAMGVVFAATAAGYAMKQYLLERNVDFKLTVTLCAFVSTVLACADSLFHLGSTPGLSTGTSVLYLVPGIPFINSFSDMLSHRYICAFGRAMDAVVTTCCLSAGLFLGMMMMGTNMF